MRVVKSRVRGDAAEHAAAAAAELVTVHTSDGEEFPVHRRLLRPCISLTRAIREAGVGGGLAGVSSGKREAWEREQHQREREMHAQSQSQSQPRPAPTPAAVVVSSSETETDPNRTPAPPPPPPLANAAAAAAAHVSSYSSRAEASVDIDCATFDRVLVWLEAEALGRPPPDHDIRTTEELVGAADALGLRSLEDACRSKLGAHESRIRRYRWSEIVSHNAAG